MTPSWPLRLETERLILRPLEPNDYQAWRTAMAGRLPPQHKYDDGPIDLTDLDADWFAQMCTDQYETALKDESYDWEVFHGQTNQHLGKVDLFTIQRQVFQWANLGYLIHNQYWRQGFAKEAVKTVILAGFEQLNYHRIEAAINLDNHASIALVRSLGLNRECIRRGFWYENEQWIDHVIYTALPADFGLSERPPNLS
ncbi:MAG: GNAT family protein [Cyanobacteria bacterium P01_H01_bin.153]